MATRRNKTKRVIFNFLRLKHVHRKAGRDVLIIVLPPAAGLTKEEIQKELDKFLDKK